MSIRIRRIDISRFGRIRDRSFDVSPGMTVFYGPNESGKTTTMEFIRSTLVPTTKRSIYPERTKQDSGSITVDDEGTERTVTLEHRRRGGDVPECIRDQDPDLFRGIFAMNPAELDDRKVIEEGDVKTRFLTVPGGERMPEALDSLSKTTAEILGKTAASNSRYVANLKDSSDVAERISEMRSKVAGYGELSRQLEAADAEMDAIKASSSVHAEDLRTVNLYKANAKNYARLSKLGEERRALGEFTPVTEEDIEAQRALDNDLIAKAAVCESISTDIDNISGRLRDADQRKVSSFGTEIDSVVKGSHAYEGDLEDLRGIRSEQERPKAAERNDAAPVGRGSPALMAVGALMALVGLVGCLVSPYTLIITAAGAAVLVLGMRRKSNRSVPVQTAARSDDRIQEVENLEKRISDYESSVSRLMAELGLLSTGTLADVTVLGDVRDAATKVSARGNDLMKAKLDKMGIENSLGRFYARYSGEDGFKESVRRTSELQRIDREIESLRGYITSAGLDPDVPDCPVKVAEDTSMDRTKEIGQRIGEIRKEMNDLLDMKELDSLIDRKVELESERREILISGATAFLASTIAEHACTDIYSSVQPGVVETANRYLGMMTDGRYVLDLDPRNNSLSVRSDEGVKDASKWSTGLMAQVLLSVKLAIAKEMGGGEIPMILDDVLLTFDSDRKEGACRALSEVSGEMQILLFTCDRETSDIASNLDGVSVIAM